MLILLAFLVIFQAVAIAAIFWLNCLILEAVLERLAKTNPDLQLSFPATLTFSDDWDDVLKFFTDPKVDLGLTELGLMATLDEDTKKVTISYIRMISI